MREKIILKYVTLAFLFFGLGFTSKEIISDFRFVDFFNSNFFIAATTIFVGGFAVYLYKKQQNDGKKDAAKLIVQEIRYAEQQIRNARMLAENNYYLANKLLPTSSWHKNIHLFINDLKESQIDLISQFYSQAKYLDEVINIISDEKNKMWDFLETKQLPDGNGVMQSSKTMLQGGTMIPEKHLAQLHASRILHDVSKKIEFIYNSPAVDKLRDISEGRL